MSLIHEALEKLEHEKKGKGKTSVPSPFAFEPFPLKSNPKETPRDPTNMRTIYAAIAGVLLFFSLLGFIYFLTNFSQTEKENTRVKKVSVPSTPSNRALPAFLPLEKQRLFSLTGISRTGDDWTAIVNNQLVRVGDTVNGARVEAIQEQKVVLDFKDQTVTLSLYG